MSERRLAERLPWLYLGMKTIKVLIFAAVALLLAWLPITKFYWDMQVRRLCAIDGGDRVYETVVLPADQFSPQLGGELRGVDYRTGQISVEPGYAFSMEDHFYKTGDPDMLSSHSRVTRNSDGKLMGESTIYMRRGGGFLELLGAHPSGFSCPDTREADITTLIRKTFVPAKATP